MATHSYPVEVQSDFLEKITRANPVQALAEFIWNSLDADSTVVEVNFEFNELGAMSRTIIRDFGTGIDYKEAPELFGKLGGSWKKPGGLTKKDGRYLHGHEGRGRFKAFALGRVAEWEVTNRNGGSLSRFFVSIKSDSMKQVVISDEENAPPESRPGVVVTISEMHKDFKSLASESGLQDLTQLFALYLANYKGVSITVNGDRIDLARAVASQHDENLQDIVDENGKKYPVRLDIIEWKSTANRALYLCNEKGFPLLQADRRFHVGEFQFSAYIKSEYISKLQKEGSLEIAEMDPLVIATIDAGQERIKAYFRARAAQEAKTVVAGWKESEIYPYHGDPATKIEEAERQVFDIVAVTASQYLPDFSTTASKNKAFHLRLLRQAIEKSPEELQLILGEVLKLPKRKQEELAELLKDVSLSSIINAAKIVADRLRFLAGLDTILFDPESKKRLRERSQLHKIIAQNCWLFGEEFNLSVDDKSLTELLRKHRKLLGDATVIHDPVKHVSQERGIVDLVFSRAIRRHKADELTHLVVELKAPKVKIDQDEILQVEKYAMSVMNDERFKSVNTNWVFWAISDDYGDYAKFRMKDNSENSAISGKIHEKGSLSILVKTWAQVLEENRSRLQFFQERLEYEADKGAALKHLEERYSKFLQGVIVDEPIEQSDSEDDKKLKTPKVRRILRISNSCVRLLTCC